VVLNHQPCSLCGTAGPRILEAVSRDAVVNYYRCDACGAVWNRPKNAPEPIFIVVNPHVSQKA